jgi:hypothetical protein
MMPPPPVIQEAKTVSVTMAPKKDVTKNNCYSFIGKNCLELK